MKSYRILFLLSFLGSFSDFYAQLSTNEQPISFGKEFKFADSDVRAVPAIIMPELDMKLIEAEDRIEDKKCIPPRFGYRHKVNYDINNSGVWHLLPNGDKLWQLNIICPNALSVNFCYDKFWIPEGGKFFVYSRDRKNHIGAFTSANNKGDNINVGTFATTLIYGNDIMLEYYQPKWVTSDAIISIEYIVHGYKLINIGERSPGESGNCQVNINCDEGNDWQNEKKGVAIVLVHGSRYASGSLINTTNLGHEPYFLTAHHCLIDSVDASGNNVLDYYSFVWRYEAKGCEKLNAPNSRTTHGAVILANDSLSDFALLRLIEDPMSISDYTPYYLGWDCSGQSDNPGVCIHHPSGDTKKISSVAFLPTKAVNPYYTGSQDDNFWKVFWKATPNGHGTTEHGSSGSPLLNAEHKIIGQLYGGDSSCDSLYSADYYGRFDISWNGYNNDSIQRKLSCWLDSLNTGEQKLEGLLVVRSDSTMAANQQLYSNIKIMNNSRLTIQGDIELKGNSRVIVEPASSLIIDGGILSNTELVLKSGASLIIVNGGIIETRNNFTAPFGAIVEIENGQLLINN